MKNKINFKNYYKETKATFKYIKTIAKNKMFSYKLNDQIMKDLKELIPGADLDFVSGDYSDITRSISIYFIDKKKKLLYRLSDHWSECDLLNNKTKNNFAVNECGYIRSCYWKLHFPTKLNNDKHKFIKRVWNDFKNDFDYLENADSANYCWLYMHLGVVSIKKMESIND